MADLFTSLVAIAPGVVKVAGRQGERAPGISPSMKDGIWGERSFAPGGIPTYGAQAAMNAIIQARMALSANLNAVLTTSLAANLVGYWPLDGNSIATVSSAVGTDTSVSYAAAKINSGAVFTGGTSRISLAGGPALGTVFSISAWLFPTSNVPSYGAILSRSGVASGLFRKSTTKLSLYDAGDHLSAGNVTISVWTHVVLTSDGTSIRFYLNGTLDTTTVYVPTTFTAGQIGSDTSSEGFIGTIDEVGTWTRALSGPEITTLYNAGAGRHYPF